MFSFCSSLHKIHQSRAAKCSTCVCLALQVNHHSVHCAPLIVCVCVHKRPRLLCPDNWPCNLFDMVSQEYPCCPSPVTWLPGNRNGVPLSFTFKAKCTSVFQLLQPMSTGATGGRGDEIEVEKKRKCIRWRGKSENGEENKARLRKKRSYSIDRFYRD